MVCRNKERAEQAKQSIVTETKSRNVHVLLCDCSLEASVRQMWQQFLEHREKPKLHGLLCNAGVLLNDKQLTTEGIEVTFACHLLFGTYLLGELAMPLLEASKGRVGIVSSGGMYNTKFPDWDVAASLKGAYSGNMVYAYAKRGSATPRKA